MLGHISLLTLQVSYEFSSEIKHQSPYHIESKSVIYLQPSARNMIMALFQYILKKTPSQALPQVL